MVAILTWQLRAPKVCVTREKERKAKALSPFMTLKKSHKCHFRHILFIEAITKTSY